MYFYYNDLTTWLNPSTSITYIDASFIPYFYNGTNYDFENGMNSDRQLGNREYFNTMGIIFPDNINLWADTNTYRNGYRTGYPALLTSKNEIPGLSPLPTASISGKYRIPSAVGIGYSLPFSTVKVKCYFNNDYYDYISFTTGKEYQASGYNKEDFGSNYTALGFIKAEDSNSLALHVTSWSGYATQVIDFGDTPQIVPSAFKKFFDDNFESIYPYSYTVKSSDGQVTLASITESPSMVNAVVTYVSSQKTLKLIGSNDVEYVLTWLSETPEGKTFLGLSNEPNSNRPILPVGVDSSVNWSGDLILYESYGNYKPPATVFDINLYRNSAEVNRVDKSDYLLGVGTLSGALREECSLVSPVITFRSDVLPSFNYVYIPIFNRFYFVTDITSVNKNIWRMTLKCDVLMTYKASIFNLQGVIGRQENEFNKDLIDSVLPCTNEKSVEYVEVSNNIFNTQAITNLYNYVVTVVGGSDE